MKDIEKDFSRFLVWSFKITFNLVIYVFKLLGVLLHELYKLINKNINSSKILILGPDEAIKIGATPGGLYDYSQTAPIDELAQFIPASIRVGDFWLGNFVNLRNNQATKTGNDICLPNNFLLQHVLVVGQSGAGKTELLMKSADSLMRSGHLIAVDAAGFLGNRLYPSALNAGSKLCCWDLNATSNQVVWNFLEELEKFGEEQDVRSIAASLFGQFDDRDKNAPFWKMYTNWLAGLIGIAVEARKKGAAFEPSELIELVVDRDKVKRIMQSVPEARQKWGATLHSYLNNTEFSRDSQFLIDKLAPFQDSRVKAICDGKSEIFLSEAINRGYQKYTLVIGQSLADGNFGSSLAAVMVSYIMKLMYKRMQNPGAGWTPTYMICDEARRLENIDYEELTGIGRNASSGVILMCQSMDQFSDRQLVAVQNNCRTQIFLQGVSYNSAEWMSKQIGEYQRPTVSMHVKSGVMGSSPFNSKTLTYQNVKKLGTAEITTRPPGLPSTRSAIVRVTSSDSRCTKPFLTDYAS